MATKLEMLIDLMAHEIIAETKDLMTTMAADSDGELSAEVSDEDLADHHVETFIEAYELDKMVLDAAKRILAKKN